MKRRARKTFIYALYDPRKPRMMRYVGKANDVERRLRAHIRDAVVAKVHTYKLHWIRSLLKVDIELKVKMLEQVSEKDWKARERHWIREYRRRNHPLTNCTDGGDGLLNPSQETRKKIGSGNRGRKFSIEYRRKLSESHRGITPSTKTRRKLSASHMGHIVTLDTRRKIGRSNSISLRGRVLSIKHRKALSKAHYGKPLSTEHRKKLRIGWKRRKLNMTKEEFYGR